MTDTPTVEIVPVESVELSTPEPGLFPHDPADWIADVTARAKVLANVIDDQKLFVQIKGRKHVKVEGWLTVGAMVGVFPQTEWTRTTPDFARRITKATWTTENGKRKKSVEVIQEGRGAWEARVRVVRPDGAVISAAEAECGYEEETWQTRDSYALRSMAQTRATSKALAQALRFIVSIAGFDPTPEEEMPGSTHPKIPLDAIPDGTEPLNWTKQVAGILVVGRLHGTPEVAEQWWADAMAQAGVEVDVTELTAGQALAVASKLRSNYAAEMGADQFEGHTEEGYH
jgi:hypothetical protein